ncbi:MAG: hypothetical protein ACJ712_08380 [Nitrososphaeraceae archaeon]
MIIPKSVRHLIDDEEMYLDQKKGVNGQLHFGNLHENMMSIIQFIAIRSIQGTIRSDNHRLILQNIWQLFYL